MKLIGTFINSFLVRGRKCLFRDRPFISRQICASPHHLSPLAPGWGSKKNKKPKTLQLFNIMADPKSEEILAPLRAAVKEQVDRTIVSNSAFLLILVSIVIFSWSFLSDCFLLSKFLCLVVNIFSTRYYFFVGGCCSPTKRKQSS